MQFHASYHGNIFFQGYLVVENFFTHDELDPCKDAVGDLVEELAQKLYNAGKIKSKYKMS